MVRPHPEKTPRSAAAHARTRTWTPARMELLRNLTARKEEEGGGGGREREMNPERTEKARAKNAQTIRAPARSRSVFEPHAKWEKLRPGSQDPGSGEAGRELCTRLYLFISPRQGGHAHARTRARDKEPLHAQTQTSARDPRLVASPGLPASIHLQRLLRGGGGGGGRSRRGGGAGAAGAAGAAAGAHGRW